MAQGMGNLIGENSLRSSTPKPKRPVYGRHQAVDMSGDIRYYYTIGGNNSVVECNLAKVEVAGSNPVSRSN